METNSNSNQFDSLSAENQQIIKQQIEEFPSIAVTMDNRLCIGHDITEIRYVSLAPDTVINMQITILPGDRIGVVEYMYDDIEVLYVDGDITKRTIRKALLTVSKRVRERNST